MTNATFEEVTTELVSTDKLSLGGHPGVTGISDDYTENSGYKLPTSQALFNGLRKIQTQVDVLNNIGLGLDNVVISTPIVSPIFGDDGYVRLGWEIYSNNVAVYVGDTVNNYIQLPHTLFATNKHYIFNIKVHTMQSGRLEIRDKDGDIIEVMTAIGDYYFEVLADVDSTFKIIAKDVEFGKMISISYLAVHQVSDQFYNYLTDKIKELSSVDGQGYVEKTLFETRMDEIETAFQTAITATNNDLLAHINDKNNPHTVTCLQIGAAPMDHHHNEEYYLKNEIVELINLAINTRALVNHLHPNYTTGTEVQEKISTSLTEALKNVHTVSPLAVLEGPTGLLPEMYNHSGITPPSQLLITNTFNHSPDGPYDVVSGYASSNIEPNEGSKIEDAFVKYTLHQKQAMFTKSENKSLVIHYQFHRARRLLGYIIRGLDTGYVSKWSLYMNFNTFVHSVNIESYNPNGYEVLLPISQDCISFSIEVLDATQDIFGIHIEPIFDDIETGHIGVSEDPMLLSIPRSGNNLIFTLDLDAIDDVTPTLKIEGLPMYVYVEVDELGKESLGYTYIAPEFGTIRKGINVFENWFGIGLNQTHPEYDPYKKLIHPVFGKLQLMDPPASTSPLIDVYVGDTSWEISQNICTIEHVFNEPTFMVGYDLMWDRALVDKLPTEWTLKLYTINDQNEEELVVVDSVNMHGGKLNYNKSSILYCKTFNKVYKVRKYELYMKNTKDTGLYLTKFSPMLSNDFYNTPKNTMYCGNIPVSKIYLGIANYQDGDFIVTSQNVIGTTCHLPINNLATTDQGYEYKVVNPFHTTDVSCTVRYVDGDTLFAPNCGVIDIQDNYITVLAFSEHQFVLTVVRNW